MINLDYQYTTKITDHGKYALYSEGIVDAVYTKACMEEDEGNPFIECLPEPLDNEGIKDLYYKPFKMRKNALEAPVQVQLTDVDRLREIRMPLPFLPTLEMQFRNSLLLSHRQRMRDLRNMPFNITVGNEKIVQNVACKPALGGDTGIGVTLLGIGGCGKSEAIMNMISRYPQIIHHNIKDVGEFIQIVWLKVTTPSNANLNQLYIEIADSLDHALDNLEPVYGKLIRAEKSIAGKASYIAKLIRLFNISSIILDEIQNLDSGKNRDSSYNSLMEIINTTKVSLVIVGTEEAYMMLCRKYYLARRTGKIIDASKYCYDSESFNKRMSWIMKYNWFKPDVKMAPMSELLKELYTQTRGIIERMISIWIDVQAEYISARDNEKPAITPTFIKLVANNSNPLMGEYAKQTLENSPLLFDFLEENPSKPLELEAESAELLSVRQHVADNLIIEILNKTKNPKSAERIYQRVKDSLILMGTPYNDQKILEKVVSVMNRSTNESKPEDEIARNVIKALKRQSCDARPVPKLPQITVDKEEFVKNFTGDNE